MRMKRPLFAGLVLFAFALGWNGLIHAVVLARMEAAVRPLRRPDFADRWWLALALTAGVVALFLAGYVRCARTGSLREGLCYGAGFGCLAGLLADLNQYLLYPIPTAIAALWFAGGLLEFSAYGALASRFCRIAREKDRAWRLEAKPPPAQTQFPPAMSAIRLARPGCGRTAGRAAPPRR